MNESIELYNKYMETDEVIKGYELERERMIIKTKMAKARREGIEEGIEQGIEQGEEKERYQNVQELIQSLYQINASQWLKECTHQQLLRAFNLVGKHLSYEEFKCEMLK